MEEVGVDIEEKEEMKSESEVGRGTCDVPVEVSLTPLKSQSDFKSKRHKCMTSH